MIILAWIAIVAIAFFAGANLWTLIRTQVYLPRLLRDFMELRRLVGSLSAARLVQDAQGIEPLLGSFAKSLAIWDQAQLVSLRGPRNLFLFVGAVDLAAAYFVSPWCLATAGVLLALPALFPVGYSTKSNCFAHVQTILLILIKWRESDADECLRHCCEERPDLLFLYSLVPAIVTGCDFPGRQIAPQDLRRGSWAWLFTRPERKPAFPIADYALNMTLRCAPFIRELSRVEYQALGAIHFVGGKIYHAPDVQFVGRWWTVTLGACNGKLYKIALCLVVDDKAEAIDAVLAALAFCSEQLGRPAEQQTGSWIWDTADGNVVLQTVAGLDKFAVNLVLTGSSVRDFAEER
jgi:hypothetical protein